MLVNTTPLIPDDMFYCFLVSVDSLKITMTTCRSQNSPSVSGSLTKVSLARFTATLLQILEGWICWTKWGNGNVTCKVTGETAWECRKGPRKSSRLNGKLDLKRAAFSIAATPQPCATRIATGSPQVVLILDTSGVTLGTQQGQVAIQSLEPLVETQA